MDFSWVRQLAEESNQHELDKLEKERLKLEEERLAAIATVPFVEKLFMLVQACCEEFNKHTMFPELRVLTGRLTKKSKGPYPEDIKVKADEVAYFVFTRKQLMCGIRGINGNVEFVEFPVSDGPSALGMKLDEASAEVRYKLVAKAELEFEASKKRQIIWTYNDENMDGPKLISLCQHYFSEFIKRTND